MPESPRSARRDSGNMSALRSLMFLKPSEPPPPPPPPSPPSRETLPPIPEAQPLSILTAPDPNPRLDGVEARLLEVVWYVCVEGESEPEGPLSAYDIARKIRAGTVPSYAMVRHESEVFWSDVVDAKDLVDALKEVSTESKPPPQSNAPPPLAAKVFLVWIDGGAPVGPVSADQLARGIRSGKVPSHASIQRIDDIFAVDVLDAPEVIEALKRL